MLLKLPKWYGIQSALYSLILHTIENIDRKIQTIIHIPSLQIINDLLDNNQNKTHTHQIINYISKHDNQINIYYSSPPPNISKEIYHLAKLANKLNYHQDLKKISREEGNKIIKRKVYLDWNRQWKKDANNTLLYKMKPNVFTKNPTIKLKRRDQIKICRIRIGHTILTHQHILKKDEPPLCDRCNKPLKIEHLLINCTSEYHRKRMELKINTNLGSLLKKKSKLPQDSKIYTRIEP